MSNYSELSLYNELKISYTDDEPFDGPSHYIIISGIYSPTFFKYLDEFNLPIDCLIKFRAPSECDELLKQFLAEIDERERLETNLKANLKLNRKFIPSLIAIEYLYIKNFKLILPRM